MDDGQGDVCSFDVSAALVEAGHVSKSAIYAFAGTWMIMELVVAGAGTEKASMLFYILYT